MKKGTITLGFFVKVLMAVVVVLILIYVILPFSSKTIYRQVNCEQSIVLRSNAKVGALDGRDYLPLKCKTEKICFSLSGEDCNELSDTEDNEVINEHLSCNEDKCSDGKRRVMEVLADKLRSCHKKLGEGRLNFISNSYKGSVYALICNRFVFDDEAKEKLGDIGGLEFHQYLGRKADGDQSYLEYIYPRWKNPNKVIEIINSFKEGNVENVEDNSENNKRFIERVKSIDPVDWKIVEPERENGYMILASITEEEQGWYFKNAKGGAIGAAVLTGGLGLVASGVGAPVGIVLIGTSSLVAGGITGGLMMWHDYNGEYKYASPVIMPYDIQSLRGIGAYNFEIAP